MIRTAGTRTGRTLRPCTAATSLLLLALAAASGAWAQDGGSSVLNGQVTLGDVMSTQSLHVESADEGANGQAVAIGNTATAIGQDGPLAFTSTQRYGAGALAANSSVVTDGGAGPLLNNVASATGNTATAGTCCGATTGTTSQTVDPGATVYAQTFSQTGALSAQASADATAIGNTQGWEAANGSVAVTSVQAQGGRVQADNGVSLKGGTSGLGGYSATAVSNDVTVAATASPVSLTARQTVTGDLTRAAVDASQLGGDTVAAQATATGNNLSVATDGGAAAVNDVQANAGAVQAQSDLAVDSWNTASSVAYGVGNSAILTNQGPATSMTNDQTNTGAVTVGASFDGRTGGDATLAATAVGNAVSAYACATCNGGVEATNRQTSSGPVRATATLTGGAIGSVTSAASAIGNTATFQVQSSSH